MKEKMEMLKRNIALVTLAAVLASGSALAQTAPAEASATSEASTGSWTQNVGLSFSSILWGPGLGDISSYQPNIETGKRDPESRLLLENTLKASYKLDAKNTLALGWDFYAYPVRGSEAGDKFEALDPSVRWNNSSVLKVGNFNLGTEFRAYVPVYAGWEGTSHITHLRAYGFLSYEIPNSRFGLAMTALARQYLYSDPDAAAGKWAQRFYVGPEVSYQISPTVSAWLLFEANTERRMSANFVPVNDIEPGITWNVTPNITFSPFLDIPTHKRVAFDTTTINASLTLKAL